MNRFILTFLGVGLAFVQPTLQAQTPAKQPASPIIITNGPTGTENGKARANTPYLSTGVSDIIRMFQAGVEEPVIMAFIQSSTVPYHPSAREVIYLREVGLPQSVITALLKRGGELRDRAAEADREERARAPQPAAPAPAQSPPASTTTPEAQAAAYPAATYAAPYGYPMRAIRPTPTRPIPMGIRPLTVMAVAIGLIIRTIILAVTAAIIAVIVGVMAVIMGPAIAGRGLESAFTARTSASGSARLAAMDMAAMDMAAAFTTQAATADMAAAFIMPEVMAEAEAAFTMPPRVAAGAAECAMPAHGVKRSLNQFQGRHSFATPARLG